MLKETIFQNLNSAVKEKRVLEVSVLRQLLAVFLNKEKEKRFKLSKEQPDISVSDLEKESVLNDEEAVKSISSEAKKRKESITEFEKGGRKDLVEKEKKELEILEKYLPKQLEEDEIKQLVKQAIEKTGTKSIKEIGKVMAELMPQIKGKADGGLVNKIVRELLPA